MLKNVRFVIKQILIVACGFLVVNADAAGGTATPQETIQTYLDSLVYGDTTTLAALIDGTLKDESYRLLTENPTYPDILRSHYARASITIEKLYRTGANYNAQVRFQYSTSDSSTCIFVLNRIDGQWKIVNEQDL